MAGVHKGYINDFTDLTIPEFLKLKFQGSTTGVTDGLFSSLYGNIHHMYSSGALLC